MMRSITALTYIFMSIRVFEILQSGALVNVGDDDDDDAVNSPVRLRLQTASQSPFRLSIRTCFSRPSL